MKKIKLILFAAFGLSCWTAKAQNNLSCDSAKLITYNPINGVGTSFNNLVDGTPVWFSFIANSSSMEVLIKNTTDTSFFQAEITVLYSGTCNTLVKIAADSIDCQTDTTLGIVYSNLVVGQTYRIEVIKGSTAVPVSKTEIQRRCLIYFYVLLLFSQQMLIIVAAVHLTVIW